ncbi:hypothetical protein B1H18_28995 [Streptomyces tsukubensis]|uniref:CBM6 domain-containing protein n=1 Tax=Streptomyces tsukubensis TaxID=83656 RepID=A0A1V4A230_9ACTN|nr:hypothetical protein B1H18_28995 [Streptomyces tsukubensis]
MSGAQVASGNSGYTGGGYLAFAARSGAYAQWTVEAAGHGRQELSFRYASEGTTERPLSLTVNGRTVAGSLFPPTGGASHWRTVTVRAALRSGVNTVRVTTTSAAGGPALDWLAVGTWRRADTDWSTAVVGSTMSRFTPARLGGWGYPQGLYLQGQYLVHKRSGDPEQLAYIKAWADRFVDADGAIGVTFDSLDSVQPGNLLLLLYAETGDERYATAARTIKTWLDTYPRTGDGAFWHALYRRQQLWGDGTFMVLPFLLRYGELFGGADRVRDDAAHNLVVYGTHLQDEAGGLLLHAYDEARAQTWADPATGRSAERWCRAMGWYGMATMTVLDSLPADHPDRPAIVAVLRHLIAALARHQDPATGRWFQVVDKGRAAGNWTETSSTSMYIHTIASAKARGLIDGRYDDVVRRGYRGVLDNVSLGPDGLVDITDICVGTNVGDLAFYFARPRATNDLHGLGAFLLMNELLGEPGGV